jgi:hypothetical protein
MDEQADAGQLGNSDELRCEGTAAKPNRDGPSTGCSFEARNRRESFKPLHNCEDGFADFVCRKSPEIDSHDTAESVHEFWKSGAI